MNKSILIIGIPLDLGQAHRGVNICPSAIRYAGLADRLRKLGYQVTDCGNLDIPVRETLIETGEENVLPSMIEANEKIFSASKKAIHDGFLPIFLGGDHSISIGTISGVVNHGSCGVIWIDAHGDYNNPNISTSGNIHGMPLAILMGKGSTELVNIGGPGPKLKPENVVMIGVRELDLNERKLLRQSGIKVYTMRDIDEQGMNNVIKSTMGRLANLEKIHVSLDVDGLDPKIAPGVGTPVPGGLTYREAHLLMETIADSKKLTSMDIVEINPMLDRYNETAKMAIELTVSLFGKNIM
jgi:arginase